MDEQSSAEVVELVREYCDNGIRYYTWALQRMPSIPEQAASVEQVRSLRSSLAHVLAILEGARGERDVMLKRDEVIRRYVAVVADEEWQPPFSMVT